MNQVKQQKSEAILVKTLAMTDGYEVLVRDLTSRRDTATRALIHSNDPQETLKLQAEIRAYDELFKIIDTYLAIDTKSGSV